MNNCKICNIKKNWNGSDIICCFKDSQRFGDNWNCGLINRIRDLCKLAIEGKDDRLHYQFCQDQKYVIIKTDDIADMGLCLYVSWYKSRGRTEAMWILDEYNQPKLPTINDLKTILEHYEQ